MYVPTTSIEYFPQMSKGVIKKYFHVGYNFLNSTTSDKDRVIGVDLYSKKVTPAFFVEAGVESNDVNRFAMLMPFSSGISPALCADVDDVDKCFERTMAAHLRTSQSLPDRQWLDNKERC
jgi:hypothetical protein